MIRGARFQQRFAINVWAGIIGNSLFDPLEFFCNTSFQRYQKRYLWTRAAKCYLNDEVLFYISRQIMTHLNKPYENRCIGHTALTRQPARSTDLKPNVRIFVVGSEIRETSDILARVCTNSLKRRPVCIGSNGRYFEFYCDKKY